MDHLVSAQPGLIPQITGNLTGQRINRATVIVDHFSDHVYVYLMRNLTLDETILAKHAYERFLSSIRVTAKSYHSDNGRFADQGFREDCNRSNQVITFCSVGSHHQNSIAERKIKDLTLGAQTIQEQRPPWSQRVLSHKHPPLTTAITAQAQIIFWSCQSDIWRITLWQ